MSINSAWFLLFVGIVSVLYFAFPKKIKWIVLLCASYIFYWLNSNKLIIYLLISTLSIYFMGLALKKIDCKQKELLKKIDNKDEKKRIKNKNKIKKKWIVALGVIINFGILAILKYSSFIAGNLNELFNLLHISIQIPLKKFVLPLGISYYTLQSVSYIVDVYRGKIEADKNLGRLALYVSFFPGIVEGPIARYEQTAKQLYEPHEFDYKNIKFGLQLMLWGFFKKMVVADRAGIFVNEVFNNYTKYEGIPIVIAIIFYTLQIYAEFSGCMDIVTGTAQIVGINLPKNFERPFFSKSVQEFWRRWHITLGTWLKDYIFYPISFSKDTTNISKFSKKIFKNSYITKLIPAMFALLFVWLGNGIWHGASWKYIIYGLYYYVIMMIGMIIEPLSNKILDLLKIKKNIFGYRLLQIVRTNIFVGIGMMIFRSQSIKNAWQIFKSIFTVKNIGMIFNGELYKIGFLTGDFIIILVSIIIMFVISYIQESGHAIREDISKQNLPFRWILYYGIIFSIIIFGIYGQGYNVSDFIYGQF